LLRIIAGFEAPDAGQLTLAGAALANGPLVMPAHRRGIGLVAQEGALFPHLTIAANIGFGIPRGRADRDARVAQLLDMVGLDRAMLVRRPDQLSGGQQQRVALARALACEPRLMLLDEPFSALDTGLRASTRKAVADLLGAHGITTILVTHDQAEALNFADQVAMLQEGRLVQAGPPRELYMRPRDVTVAQFLGDAIVLPAVLADGLADCALGRVETDAPGRSGPAELMLRPEQVAIRRGGDGAVRGRVESVDFAGAVCTAMIALEAPAPLLLLRCASFDLPAAGEVVSLAVRGVVHVLDARA
jgi:iron(III) transport system ATP-binding protein